MKFSNNIRIEFTNKELNALAIIDDMLEDFQNEFTSDAVLTAAFTGETIELIEIARIRGILNGLVRNNCWQVETKEEEYIHEA